VGVTRLCGESSNSRVSDSQPPFHGGSDLRLCQAPRTTARTRSLVFSLTLYRYVLLMKCLSPVVLFLDNLPIGQSVCLDSLFRRNSCVFGDKKTHDRLPVPLLPLCVRLPAAMAALCRSGVARERMARFLASSLRRTAVSPRCAPVARKEQLIPLQDARFDQLALDLKPLRCLSIVSSIWFASANFPL
jgi:hypothetical protein